MNANIIPTILTIMERKDPLTLIHLSKVQQFINLMIPGLTKKNIISEMDIPDIWTSAILHDVGKIFINDYLLKAKRKLSQEEIKVLREHPVRGYNFLKSLNLPDKILDAIKYHHERWDGKTTGKYPGYPEGRKGFDIPLYARIIQVADAFDAMVSYRYYKKQKTVLEALKEIKNLSGTQFDPYISQIFVESLTGYKIVEK
ncbi:MAG TPA: HD domain-containing protein [Candidatus Atribacteria bacterium]|nr:HD domain-containing protein [Candidatus Atribacteria bacterium]